MLYVERVAFTLRNIFAVSDLDYLLLGGFDFDVLDRFVAEELNSSDVFIICETVLNYFDVGILWGNGEWLNGLYCLLHIFWAGIPLDDFIIGCERENVLLEVGHYYPFDAVVFFNRQVLAVVEVSIDSLAIVQTFVLFSIFKEIARVQYLFWIP